MGTTASTCAGCPTARFTPMHMGTTSSARRCCNRNTVHPHAHGDNGDGQGPVHAPGGSPPCTWGQPRLVYEVQASVRFTPMHMGTTAAGGGRPSAAAVHPHAHGDNVPLLGSSGPPCGSPPCTWGQRIDEDVHRGQLRFTPMHMGTTLVSAATRVALPVHPHAHGDNMSTRAQSWPAVGSPPCTWGQLIAAAIGGEQKGSPPCTWGQRNRACGGAVAYRFTPMHMGTTCYR